MIPQDPKPPSPARVAAGRANGLKSRNTKTPEGKAASALNATTHGFSARTIILSVEDSEAFREMRDHFIRRYRPADPVEQQLLDDVIIAKWRHRRVTTVENTTLEIEMQNVEPEIDAKYLRVSGDVRLAFAYRSAEKSERLLSAINRHAARIFREYRQAFQIFKEERLNSTPPSVLTESNPQKVNPQNEGNAPIPSTPEPQETIAAQARGPFSTIRDAVRTMIRSEPHSDPRSSAFIGGQKCFSANASLAT